MTGPLYVVWCTGMRGPELVTCVDEFSIAVDIARRSAPAAIACGTTVRRFERCSEQQERELLAAILRDQATGPRYPLSTIEEPPLPVEAPVLPVEERPTVPVAGDHAIPATLPAAPMRARSVRPKRPRTVRPAPGAPDDVDPFAMLDRVGDLCRRCGGLDRLEQLVAAAEALGR